MAFDDAGPYIRKYYERLQNAWRRSVEQGEHPSCSSISSTNIHTVYPMELLEECKNDLEKAKNISKRLLIKKRISFLEKGLLYVMLTLKAVQLTKELESQGIPIMEHNINDEEEIIKLQTKDKSEDKLDKALKKFLSDAIQAWKIRDQYVESLKDDFIISYFWIKYNDANRFFNPIKRLKDFYEKLG
jgi:hypothetical protein